MICDKKESNTDINGLFIGTVICKPCDEVGAEIIKEKYFEGYNNSDDDTMPIF